ncbi:hypothetical protein D3C71_1690130 [compost metagenome]
MAGPFDIFETDQALEKQGINLDYGDFEVTVARAGGSNTAYEKAMLDVHKKHKYKLENGLFAGDEANRVLAEVYAATVVLGWRSKKFGEGKLEGKGGKPIEFSRQAVADLLVALPALFQDVRARATAIGDFRKAQLEADVKNS